MSPAPTRNLRIHVVEDESIVALDLRLQLTGLGYEVTGVSSDADAAVRAVDQLRPDLVLMDINLGKGGDGIGAAQAIMQAFSIPVVYLTAYAEPDTVRRASEVAPYGYLLKPVEIRELHAAILVARAQHRERSELAMIERRLRLALDAGRLGVIEYSPSTNSILLDGHIDPALANFPRGFRLDREEFLRRLTPAARSQVMAMLEPGRFVSATLEWCLNSGAARWLEIHLANFSQDGMVVGIFRDVTDTVGQAESLRQAAVVFESAAEAIVILDAKGGVLSFNPAFERMTGWEASEVRGLSPEDFLHLRRNQDRLNAARQPEFDYVEGEVTCRRRDGTHFPVWLQRAPVRDDDGRISHEVLTLADISALRQAELNAHRLAYVDTLTSLPNRNQFEQELAAKVATCEHGGRGFSLLFLDLDGFKNINDGLGHDCGDQLLQALAQRFTMSIRDADFIGRLGGDEFVVLIDGADVAGAVAVGEKLRAACEAPVTLRGGESVLVSASIGIAMMPADASTGTDLVRAADSAMYAAKASGRNRIRVFTTELSQHSRQRLRMEQRLRLAIANDEFQLHFQPLVVLATGDPMGVEALLRWTSPEFGKVPPEIFIPLAEETGLILPIGQWVLDHALAQLRALRSAGLPITRMAINVSGRQLKSGRLAGQVSEALARHDVPADAVEIEVTESTLQSGSDVSEQLAQLRSAGVGVALDDFGTGYSSLASLKNLPITTVKIDRSFVRDLCLPGRDVAIARAVVDLSHALGLNVIAEGVETAGQCEALRQLGVIHGQGWLFARDMDAAACTAWLRARMNRTDGR